MNDKDKALLRWGEKAFQLARDAPTPAERSEFVAYTVGAQAHRYGFTERELSRWLQGAYSSLWVRQSSLDPGLDNADVRRLVLRAFNAAAK